MNIRKKVVDNLIWRFMERCGAQIVSFLVSIILARILSPKEYGQIAIVFVLITILNVFVDSGFGNALIQKKDADDVDFSTIFYFNICSCSFIYCIVFFIAPALAAFYRDDALIGLTRVLGVTIVVSGVKNILHAYVSKHFMFKYFFFATLIGTIFSAVVGVAAALSGCGVWALVAQHLSNTIIDTLVIWMTVKWRPKKVFSFKRLKTLFSYGYKLLMSSLLNTVYGNFRQLVIAKLYTPSELAFYNRGKQFPALLMDNINTSIDSVLFPVMSETQNDLVRVRNMIRDSMKLSTFIMWPLLMGLAAIAPRLISFVLTDKWISAVPYLQVFCFVYVTYPVQTANLNAIKAVGRSDIFFKLEIIQSACGVFLLLNVLKYGPFWIAVMYLLSSVLNCVFIINESKKIFGYGLIRQIKEILPHFVLSITMSFFVYGLYFFVHSNWVILLQILFGTLFYTSGAKLCKFSSLQIIIAGLKTIVFREQKHSNDISTK